MNDTELIIHFKKDSADAENFRNPNGVLQEWVDLLQQTLLDWLKHKYIKQYEVFIGDTSYPESYRVMESIGYGDWAVRGEGGKLIVAAYSKNALRTALQRTIQIFQNDMGEPDSPISLENLNILETEDALLNLLPHYDSAVSCFPRTIDQGYDSCLALISESSVTEYQAYLSKLESLGYLFYSSNTIGANQFATYINDSNVIYVGWFDYESAVRLVIETRSNLLPLEKENLWEPVDGVRTSLAQIGLDIEAAGHPDGGMGYIWQLADGSFIVIDGGYPGNEGPLYEYMKAKSPNEKIVVAAWIMTHQDGDHWMAFTNFCEKYKGEFCVEKFLFNYPGAFISEESKFGVYPLSVTVARDLPRCKVIKIHTGMKLFLRNVELEFLFTLDSSVPKPVITCNNTSLVFTVTAEGRRVLFTGDMGDAPAGIIASMYGDYLKSDILQIAHHGITNGSGKDPANMARFYEKVSAEMCVWPCSEYRYYNTDGLKAVANFGMNLNAMKNARETWVAGADQITVFEFPYEPFSGYRFNSQNPHPKIETQKNVLTNTNARIAHNNGNIVITHIGEDEYF